MSQSSQKRKYNDETNTVTTDDDAIFYSVSTIVENMDGDEIMFKFFSSLDLALKYKKTQIKEALYKNVNLQVGEFLIHIYKKPEPGIMAMDIQVMQEKTKTPSGAWAGSGRCFDS